MASLESPSPRQVYNARHPGPIPLSPLKFTSSDRYNSEREYLLNIQYLYFYLSSVFKFATTQQRYASLHFTFSFDVRAFLAGRHYCKTCRTWGNSTYRASKCYIPVCSLGLCFLVSSSCFEDTHPLSRFRFFPCVFP